VYGARKVWWQLSRDGVAVGRCRVERLLARQLDVQHYNAHRPHRSLHQHPPVGDTQRPTGAPTRVLRRDRLGGLLHEYVQVA
jgi:hypothetical protein